ncbi:alpha/beta fold hydrolase [Pseudoalteromonas denitrificans]|uniref:Lysophospholipase n=1 Tax=Pseudoalteromonas denitrificans DSM 6059 TaxID=1123010 RepID=A0A1I1NYR1_9GAMM|nr:alpha/beta fold hydrolase [Pseudoalteromonas denitrificans]SFD02729.1 lysophospholipase [Pseudoalteromonas denitrificans DSM 6059]
MFYSQENKLLNKQNEIMQFWQTQICQGILNTQDANLAYAYALPKVEENTLFTIVICSGRIESLLKYKELIWEFNKNNIAVFILDHRGQGLSSRALKNSHIGHIDSFDQYSADFNQFNLQVVNKVNHKTKFLLAHSMGCVIACDYLNNYAHSFEKVVLCSPMFGINTGNIPLWLAKMLALILDKLGLGGGYAPGQSNYQITSFIDNELTQSETRYQIFTDCYQSTEQIKLGGTSISWLNAAFNAMKKAMEHPIKLPCLILQAQADTIVSNRAQTSLHKKMPLSQLEILENGKHELLCETDIIRQKTMSLIYQFCDFDTTDKGS